MGWNQHKGNGVHGGAAAWGKGGGKGGQKGKGKGQQQGSEKGIGKGKGKEGPGPFQCKHKDCLRAAAKGLKTYAQRTECFGCGRPREEAIAPSCACTHPRYLEQEEDGFTEHLSKQTRQKIARLEADNKKLEGAAKEAKPAGAGEKKAWFTPSTEEELGTPPQVSLPHFGLTTLPVLKEPKLAFFWEQVKEFPRTAQQVVDEVHVCKTSVSLTEARRREAKYVADLGAGEQENDSAWKEMYEALLVKVRAEIATLSKKATEGVAAVETMRSSLQAAVVVEATRVAAQAEKVTAARTKAAEMRMNFVEQQAELQRRLTLFDALAVQAAEASEKADKVCKERHAEVAATWARTIAEAEKATGSSMEVEPTTLADAKSKRQLAEQALEEAKAQEKTLRGSANIGVALTQVERQKKDLERTFDKARPEDLPTPDVDWLKANLDELQGLWGFYLAYAICSPPAMTYAGAGTSVDVCQTLVGETLWEGFYGDQADKVAEEDVVPRQLHIVLKRVLMANDLAFKQSQQLEAQSKVRWEENRQSALEKLLGNQPTVW